MRSRKPITIVGGGVAGLMLGIELRRREVPVTLFEAGSYPRHRVCGEFLSGRGLEILDGTGLLPGCFEKGALWASTAAFFSSNRRLHAWTLPRRALCLARFHLDALLAERFRDWNGQLRERHRWTGSVLPEGFVRASGRRLQPAAAAWRWIGLKTHARGLCPTADLEMHFLRDAYIGLCRLADGSVNVCGLFRRPGRGKGLGDKPMDLLRGPAGSLLRQRLQGAEFLPESACAVAGLDLHPQRVHAGAECRIGDALAMIPPLTGNGMSMALESAALATDPLAAYSAGALAWTQARQEIARGLADLFTQRLRWAAAAQRLLFSPLNRPWLLFLARRAGWLWQTCFERTR